MFYTQSTSTVISKREKERGRENSGYRYPGQETWFDDVAKADVAFDD